ncbi:TUE1 protein [Gonium pectorale]|uniref:TUE1 protein n=1 Tax=Gonium pectorale TaxID=33097 RepID=A0A150H4R4_GONPE|nr:TUE1 protein [Gonium pectorale]|eukprot:KXZ56590.1 TUE1 protein [Gonium pectorale]
MPRELVTIQVGQCGNQVGCRFWDLALREHAAYNTKGVYDEALSSFFRNVDTRVEPHRNLPVGDGRGAIRTLKARSVIVDMECGVINEMLKGPLGEVLDTRQLVSDVSGAGNNWAHGHHMYGPQYHDAILDKIRITAEDCDSLQSFMLLHSLGGGTGSGVGTYIVQMLADEFPHVFRFTGSVFPSEEDDVVTSPYNALLALGQLVEHADCVLPVENQALIEIVNRQEAARERAAGSAAASNPASSSGSSSKPFDSMNGVAASLLLHMTASMRFEGPLNVDLNDITMNLVPYPRMHFLLSAMSPLGPPPREKDVGRQALALQPRTLDQVFGEVFSREHQLIRADPRHATYLACGLIARGATATIADINRNVARLRPQLKMVHWNSEGFKLGICSTPPVGSPFGLLCLANNTAIASTFTTMRERFEKLYRRRFYTHHYEQYMDPSGFEQALNVVADLTDQYAALEGATVAPPVTRLRPRGLSFLP